MFGIHPHWPLLGTVAVSSDFSARRNGAKLARASVFAELRAKLTPDVCIQMSNTRTRDNLLVIHGNHSHAHHERLKGRVRRFAAFCASIGRTRARLRKSRRESVFRGMYATRVTESRVQRRLDSLANGSETGGGISSIAGESND